MLFIFIESCNTLIIYHRYIHKKYALKVVVILIWKNACKLPKRHHVIYLRLKKIGIINKIGIIQMAQYEKYSNQLSTV